MLRNIFKKVGIILCACFCMFREGAVIVRAEESVMGIENTSILEDMKDLPIGEYPKDTEAGAQVIRFMEYGYSEYPIYDEIYGLYVYVYNPGEKAIYEHGNVINMATSYIEGEPVRYENLYLTLLDSMDEEVDGKYKNRFFKFKVELGSAYLSTVKSYAKSNGGERRYDVAGVQLRYREGEPRDSEDAKTYYFSGYAKGLSEESKVGSTLLSTSDLLETIELSVQHTNYRTGVYRGYVCDELNTVYFSIPQEVFEKYGDKLQKIKAEWREYKTKPVFVTNNADAYAALLPYVGQEIGTRYDELPWRVLWERTGGIDLSVYNYDWAKSYNGLTDGETGFHTLNGSSWYWGSAEPLTCMEWLFLRDDTYGLEDWSVTSEEVKTYMKEYTNAHSEQSKIENSGEGGYAEGLFAESIDEDRISLLADPKARRGRIVQEIDAGTTGSMLFGKEQSWWDELWHGAAYEGKAYQPIQQVQAEDVADQTAESFSEAYYVNRDDAEKVLSFCRQEIQEGNVPVLFRFAQTEYYASVAGFDKDGDLSVFTDNGYVAQSTAFLGFDIISLTFKEEGREEKILPVVSNPVDIINGFEAPPDVGLEQMPLWERLLRMMGLVLAGTVLIWLFVKVGFKVIWWVVSLPIKGIAWLWKAIFKKRE